MGRSDAHRKLVEDLTKSLADRGLIIEAGWVSMRNYAMPTDCPDIQVSEMKLAFFSGAQHLFSSIMAMLDPGADETPADLRRMGQIHAELEGFAKTLEARVAERMKTRGNA